MFYQICGWIGMIMILTAYLLLSFKKIKMGKLYQCLNLIASILMAIGLFPSNAWFSFALQVIWGIIAVISLIKLNRKRKSTRKS